MGFKLSNLIGVGAQLLGGAIGGNIGQTIQQVGRAFVPGAAGPVAAGGGLVAGPGQPPPLSATGFQAGGIGGGGAFGAAARAVSGAALADPGTNGASAQERARDLIVGKVQGRMAGLSDTPFDVFGDSAQESSVVALLGRDCVPWASDLHIAWARSGRRFWKKYRMINMGDGTYVRIACASLSPPRRNWASPGRVRNAMKSLRALARKDVLKKKAASLANKLSPPRRRATTKATGRRKAA